MQVSNNIAATNVFRNYSSNVTGLRKSMSKLSSGSRITNAGDDPSGLAMSERMRAQSRNTGAAASNVENKLNYLQTADSWMQKIQDMTGRMGELAVMANDGTKSQTDRDVLQAEFSQMQQEIKRVTGSTSIDDTGADVNAAGKFNGIALFQGGTAISQQVGADSGQVFASSEALDLSAESTSVMGTGTAWSALLGNTDSAKTTALKAARDDGGYGSMTLQDADLLAFDKAGTDPGNTDLEAYHTALHAAMSDSAFDPTSTTVNEAIAAYEAADGSGGIRIDDQASATTAITEVNSAIDFLSSKRADVGAEMKRMNQTLDGLNSYDENISATESRIRDVDVAKETATMSKFQILQQVGTAMLSQANQLPQGVLQLLG